MHLTLSPKCHLLSSGLENSIRLSICPTFGRIRSTTNFLLYQRVGEVSVSTESREQISVKEVASMVSMMGRATSTPTAVPAILVSTASRSQEPAHAAAPHLQLIRVGCWSSPARVPDCKHTTAQ